MTAETLPACPRCGHAAERVQLGEWHLVRCASVKPCRHRASKERNAGRAEFNWTVRAMGRIGGAQILRRAVKLDKYA
jgi:hypothetical protein